MHSSIRLLFIFFSVLLCPLGMAQFVVSAGLNNLGSGYSHYQTSIPFLHVFTFNLRIETNQYNSIVTNPYIPVPYFSEFTARASLGFKW